MARWSPTSRGPRVALALALPLLPLAARGAALDWSVEGDTAAVVGREARVVYRAAVPPGSRLEPDALASATTDFAVVSVEARPDGSWAWTVLPLDEGRLEFAARWTLDGRPETAPAAALAARAPDLPRDADIEDIKAPIAARPALWPWLLAALLAAAAWEARRRRRARAPALAAAPPIPPPPPDEAAERALDALAASGLWERGEHAAYYLRLTEVLKEYLEARYGEPATAMTSAEAARLLKRREPALGPAAAAREALERADLVKFARIVPGAGDGAADLSRVREVVRATTPRPPVPAPGGPA